MPKLINFSSVIKKVFKNCETLYGNISNGGLNFLMEFDYIEKCSYEMLRNSKVASEISLVIEDNIVIGKEYYFLSKPEDLEEDAGLIVALHLKKQVKELKRTVKFCSKLYNKSHNTFLDEKFLLLLNRQCGKLSIRYEVFEMFLILFEYFYKEMNLSANDAIIVSFRKINMIASNTLLKIFNDKSLEYKSFVSLIKNKIKCEKNDIISNIDLINLPIIYEKYIK